jgi:hypothetical protein
VVVMVKSKGASDLEPAYRAALDLESLVDELSADDEQARIEKLLGRFATVVRRGHLRPLDHDQP